MSLGSWNPDDGSEKALYQPDAALLQRCAGFVAAGDNWTTLPAWAQQNLPGDATQMMKLQAAQWRDALQALDNDALLALVHFFTVIEQLLPHWHAGEKSPVIYISRELKRRGTPLTRDTVLWIKANSDNRFLPNGPIL